MQTYLHKLFTTRIMLLVTNVYKFAYCGKPFNSGSSDYDNRFALVQLQYPLSNQFWFCCCYLLSIVTMEDTMSSDDNSHTVHKSIWLFKVQTCQNIQQRQQKLFQNGGQVNGRRIECGPEFWIFLTAKECFGGLWGKTGGF